MIDRAMRVLRDLLDDHLRTEAGVGVSETSEDRVAFVDGDEVGAAALKLNAVTMMLVNLEEEATMRPPDLHRGTTANGKAATVAPEVRLSLYVLFAARFKHYETGLQQLSSIIGYLQSHPVLDHRTAPDLDDAIDQLVLQLVTLTFAEQNELWSALQTPYRPSALYRMRLLSFHDAEPLAAPQITQRKITVTQ